MSVRGSVQGRLRNGVKRCRGACVTSLWKSINSAACTAHHITHAQVYAYTHTSTHTAQGLKRYEGVACRKMGSRTVIVLSVPILLRICFKSSDIGWEAITLCLFFATFKYVQNVFLSMKSLLKLLAVLHRMNIQ